ncbi:hypothetical protein ALP51_03355 [Pseudomonas savastanoi]|uniref:Uncharacterized protein n=2 Tax=Pseudomonas savastanoi TaxID=29438 RepID=A0A3M5J1X4_PSESS|nr:MULTISPECIES: hypothetical protein [Pseudomonas]KWT11502.1 hypothetical protein AL047_13125 [Pseudomonas syringae pv. broussonetiae]RMT16854.1 hypothetical protein ALP51_03355 [Pseudomonas savastanoi]
MSTTERLARLEAAQEVLGSLMAARAEWIYIESKNAQPNAAKIAQWEAERKGFFDTEDELRFDDQDRIEQVIATYGPLARAIFESQ